RNSFLGLRVLGRDVLALLGLREVLAFDLDFFREGLSLGRGGRGGRRDFADEHLLRSRLDLQPVGLFAADLEEGRATEGPERGERVVDRRLRVALRESPGIGDRSEEHTSELQSLAYLVCRLLLEKKKNTNG